MNPTQPPPQGADYSNQIRMAAMQTLSPEEQQVISQAVTPDFIQVMAKLFGDQAVSILKPLLGLPAMPPSTPTSLSAFNAQAGANGNPQFQPQETESQGEDVSENGQEEPCPQCGGNDPNCPSCSLAYPTPVKF